ncbi:MAG: hypothetical protein GY842_28400, partial [bacterium]|nr:hypothetical protein [bacterium]
GANFDLVFNADYGDSCTDTSSGTLIYIPDYTDECGNPFYPTPVTGTYALGAARTSLTLEKTGPATMYIDTQANYDITVTYGGPASCGDPANPAGDVTVTDVVPDGFTVVAMVPDEGGVWTPGPGGTGGQIEWTFDPSADNTLTQTITLQAPDRTQCEAFCNTEQVNTISAEVTDCCGCALSDSASTTTSVECDQDQVLTSGKTASAGPTGPCESMTLTNTYSFLDNPVLDDVSITELTLTENNDNLMEYVGPPGDPDSARVWFHNNGGPAVEIFCFTVSDSTPAGPLEISFEGCGEETVRDKELIVSYDMVVTDQSQPLPPCDNSHTFYSWTDLDLGPDTPSGECLGLTGVHETVPITVDAPAMQVTMSSLPGLVENCGEYPVTITVDQLSAIEPYDV